MVTLAIDQEQLRSDLKTAAAYALLLGFAIAYMGTVFEILGITDLLPALADKLAAVIFLCFYAYWWRASIYGLAKAVAELPKRVYDRYTVGENAGGSGTE